MSTSNVHQQSLIDAGSETRPLMLERSSNIPWASRFRRYLNRQRETRKWLNKEINEVHLAKRFTEDSYDDLFDNLQQFEKLVNASRAKKFEKSHDPLVLVAHTGSSSRTSSQYYVTHPSSMVDYNDNDAGNIQRTLRTASSGTVANVQCYNCSEKGLYARNCLKPRVRDSKYFMDQMLLAKQDEA
ncbi:putative ribonuclease H-like domain-containing protein [Tanacetum coccineum]